MNFRSAIIITVLALLAFIHVSFVFQMLRAPSDSKVIIGVLLIPLLFVYPLAFKYINKIINH